MPKSFLQKVIMKNGSQRLGTVTDAATNTYTGTNTFNTAIRSGVSLGTANTGVTAVHYGDGKDITTELTVSVTDALTLADNAALADGYLLFTLPAGAQVIHSAYMSMAVTAAEDTTATPDVGLGTTVASGAVNVLGGTAAFENIITGQTAADANGTATVKTIAASALAVESGDNKTIYFNVADTWADTAGADLSADIAGTVVIKWTQMT